MAGGNNLDGGTSPCLTPEQRPAASSSMELTSQEVALLSQKCGLEEESIIKQHAVFLGPRYKL